MTDKEFLRKLVKKHYEGVTKREDAPLVSDEGKGECLACGYKRKLGKIGKARGVCKKCRKEVSQ